MSEEKKYRGATSAIYDDEEEDDVDKEADNVDEEGEDETTEGEENIEQGEDQEGGTEI